MSATYDNPGVSLIHLIEIAKAGGRNYVGELPRAVSDLRDDRLVDAITITDADGKGSRGWAVVATEAGTERAGKHVARTTIMLPFEVDALKDEVARLRRTVAELCERMGVAP